MMNFIFNCEEKILINNFKFYIYFIFNIFYFSFTFNIFYIFLQKIYNVTETIWLFIDAGYYKRW